MRSSTPNVGEAQLQVINEKRLSQSESIENDRNLELSIGDDEDLPSKYENMTRPFSNGDNLIFDPLSEKPLFGSSKTKLQLKHRKSKKGQQSNTQIKTVRHYDSLLEDLSDSKRHSIESQGRLDNKPIGPRLPIDFTYVSNIPNQIDEKTILKDFQMKPAHKQIEAEP